MINIPKQPQESVFKRRESCRISTIVSGLVLQNTKPLTIVKIRRFGALKNRFLRLFGYRPNQLQNLSRRRIFVAFGFIFLLGLTSCIHSHNEDDDLRTVPVTNNPYIVPNHGSGLPMMGGG